ncbi:hypothetical protein TrispH2_004020, partial [Trichoplax sp. H2]
LKHWLDHFSTSKLLKRDPILKESKTFNSTTLSQVLFITTVLPVMDINDTSLMEVDILNGNKCCNLNCSGHEINEIKRVILAPCILFINGTFLTMFLYKKKLRSASDVPFYSMCILSIIFSACLILPIQLLISHWPCAIIQELKFFIMEFFFFNAGLHVALIGLDRYLSVAFILKWPGKLRKSRLYGCILSIWILSCVVYGLILIIFTVKINDSLSENGLDQYFIIEERRLYTVIKSVTFSLACLMPFIVIMFSVILYIKIASTGRYGRRSTRLFQLKKRRKKRIIRGVYIVLCYVCLRIPYAVYNFTTEAIIPYRPPSPVQQLLQNLAVGYFLIHPFVYSYLTYRLRNRVFKLWNRSRSTSLSQLLFSFPDGV